MNDVPTIAVASRLTVTYRAISDRTANDGTLTGFGTTLTCPSSGPGACPGSNTISIVTVTPTQGDPLSVGGLAGKPLSFPFFRAQANRE